MSTSTDEIETSTGILSTEKVQYVTTEDYEQPSPVSSLESTTVISTPEITDSIAPLERFTSTEAISVATEESQGKETTQTVQLTHSPDTFRNGIGTEDGVTTTETNLETIQAKEGPSTNPPTIDISIVYSEESSSTHERTTTSGIEKQSSTITSYNDQTSGASNQEQPSSTIPGPVSEKSTVKVPIFTSALIESGIYGMLKNRHSTTLLRYAYKMT